MYGHRWPLLTRTAPAEFEEMKRAVPLYSCTKIGTCGHMWWLTVRLLALEYCCSHNTVRSRLPRSCTVCPRCRSRGSATPATPARTTPSVPRPSTRRRSYCPGQAIPPAAPRRLWTGGPTVVAAGVEKGTVRTSCRARRGKELRRHERRDTLPHRAELRDVVAPALPRVVLRLQPKRRRLNVRRGPLSEHALPVVARHVVIGDAAGVHPSRAALRAAQTASWPSRPLTQNGR